jgi:hypothetical protein
VMTADPRADTSSNTHSFLLSASHVQSTVALNQAAADDNFEAGGALVVLWVSAAAALLSFGAWLASPYPAPPILRVLNLHLPFVNQGPSTHRAAHSPQ